MNELDAPPDYRPPRRVSGRAVVIALFAFGMTLTGLLWAYWTLHTAPFRPLQDALAAEIPGSSPRVTGGQRKMNKGTPRILQVVLRVDFDPIAQTAKGEEVVDNVETVARHYINLSEYDLLQVFLYHGVPERDLLQKEFERDLRPRGGVSPPN